MTTQQAPHHGRPGIHSTVVDQPDELLPNPELVDDLLIEDAEVEVRAYPGVVRAGLGATVWAHPGVVVDAEDGAVVYLAPGASLEEWRPGALERGTVQILRWDPTATIDPAAPRRCAVCGCIEDRACPGPCTCVAADLCSTCGSSAGVRRGHPSAAAVYALEQLLICLDEELGIPAWTAVPPRFLTRDQRKGS